MAPPVNITAVLAIDQGTTFPFDVTQRVDDAGVTFTVWYKFTAPVGAELISIWASGAQNGVGYTPNPDIWLGPDTAPVQYLSPMQANDCPMYFPVVAGTTYWIRVFHFGNTVPSNLRIRGAVFVPASAPAGSLLMLSDVEGHPAIYISPSVDYGTLDFRTLVNCSNGDQLANGSILTDDLRNASPAGSICLYNSSFVRTDITIGYDSNGFPPIRTCQGLQKWYLLSQGRGGGEHARIYRIDSAGAFTLIDDLGTFGGQAVAAKNDGSIIYVVQDTPTTAIKQWNPTTHAFIADFAAGVAGYTVRDMLVLPNDKVVACFQKNLDMFFRIYDAAGATLGDINWGTADVPNFPPARLAFNILDLNGSFWAMAEHRSGSATPQRKEFAKFNVTTFAQIQRVLQVTYDVGVYGGGIITAAPETLYGTPGTCPFLVMASASVDYSGLYVMVPGKLHDTLYDAGNVKIPNPLWQTYLSSDGG